MMKRLILLFSALVYSALVFSQSEEIADDYFKRGEFEKALITYQKLNESSNNLNIFYKIIGGCISPDGDYVIQGGSHYN